MKLSIKSLATFLVSSFVYISADECNVQSSEIQLVSVIGGSFESPLLNVIPPADTIGSLIRLVAVENEGTASSFWFKEKQRLTDGFSAQFDFIISGGKTDGFAFLVQNDKINNILGFLGSGLGFKNGLDHYIAVTFDVCSDRGATFNCLVETVSIEFKESGKSSVTLNTATLSGISLKDSVDHTVRVDYLQDVNQIVVFIDDILSSSTPIVSATLPTTAAELFGSRFGFFGFTASNFEISPANVDILSFALQQIDSDSRIANNFVPNKFVDAGKRTQFKYVAVDSCNQPLSSSELLLRGITTDNIIAKLTENIESVNEDEEPVEAKATVVNQTDGSFTIFFDMPVNRISDWDLLITLNSLPGQNMPQLKVIRTREPISEGIKTQTIILLCVLIGVLVLSTVYMVKRLDSYRKKLKEHKEDIDFGKTKETIDNIEKEIEYKMNPMIAPLDKMQKQLDYNLQVLERLKRGQEDAMDSGYTIEQLVEENEKLRREMNDLKKEEQLVEVKTGVAASQRKLVNQGGRKDFDQERA